MTAADIAALVGAASAHGGVSCFRNPACRHQHLDLRGLDGVRFYHPKDLTVGVEAGMTVAGLNAMLAERGQWLPLDVPHPERTTLGAVLATHASGPLRQGYGTVRDFTIGLEMAAASGELVHSGGKVVKNVAGYDWMKLAIGARGGIGIITAVNFKVFPQPAGFLTAVFAGLGWDQIAALRLKVLHSPLRPVALELVATPGEGRRVYLRAAGSETVLARYRREAEALAAGGELSFVAEAEEAALWRALADAPHAGAAYRCWAPAEAVAVLRAMPEAVAISGRLGVGAYWLSGEGLPPAPTPTAGAVALAARLKQALDPGGRLHGDACA